MLATRYPLLATNCIPDSPKSSRSLASGCLIAAVPLASILSFAVQPMMGKRLLPLHGGGAGTWLGAMVFFQLALLLGYAWAAWLLARPPAFQRRATLILAAAAVLSFRLPGASLAGRPLADAGWESGIAGIVLSLSLASLPAMVLLFSVSPLVHGWLRRRGEAVPYHIYAISNAGSLIGLASYPLFLEQRLGLSHQRWIVHAGVLLVAAFLALAHLRGRDPDSSGPAAPAATPEPTPPGRWFAWIALSAITCIAMLGATQILAAELGSNPLAWVGPFGVYLLSFILIFSGRWKPWMTTVAVGLSAVGLIWYMSTKGFTAKPASGLVFAALMAAAAGASFVGNALVHQLRPSDRFDRYYLALAAGGVIGGLAVSTVIPLLLDRPLEFALAAVLLLVLGADRFIARDNRVARLALAVLVVAPIAGLAVRQLAGDPKWEEELHLRNIYGYMLVQKNQSRTELMSETTIHGTQVRVDAVSAKRPTVYYTESTAAGRVILQSWAQRPSMNVGVVGLGAGTLAAYARATDRYTFWDIDPKAIGIAREHFTFLRDAAGKVEVLEADGRHGLEASAEDFDVIVIDAFSGDSVPAHLVTVEAMRIYFEKLRARKGYLLIHTSSRYADVYPVLAATARAAGQAALGVIAYMERGAPNRDWDATDTEYVVVAPEEDLRQLRQWFPLEEEGGRIRRELLTDDPAAPYARLVWTDERHAAIQALNTKLFFQVR